MSMADEKIVISFIVVQGMYLNMSYCLMSMASLRIVKNLPLDLQWRDLTMAAAYRVDSQVFGVFI